MTAVPVHPAAIDAADLAGLLAAFNEVTSKLQATHDQLRGEVARLTRELGEANSQLERSRRLAALGEMAAGIAHEVRNPLGSIRLYARMLEEDLTDRPGERGVATNISGAARAMEVVVNDVLTFAREFRLRPTQIDTAQLFERVLESSCHDGVPGWRTVEIVRSDLADAAPRFDADAGLICQALVNIVRNAFEAMAETPGRRHRLTLECASEGEWAALRVRDTGPGVSPEVIARMFNPFFTTRAAGTGLGLAIVHRIIDAHAGQVRVHNNTDGPGATFKLLLPLANTQDESDHESQAVAAAVCGPETSR
jgi:signal transduction histidine kinase